MVVINCWSPLLLLWIFLSKLEATSARSIESSAARVPTSRDGTNNYSSYGIDVSWPIQHNNVSYNFPWLPHNLDPDHHPVPLEYEGMPPQPLGDRHQRYKEFMQGCYDNLKELANMCDVTEQGRFHQCLTQPPQMRNFTDLGFQKLRAPDHVFNIIKDFWEANKHLEKTESLSKGYTYINYWESETTMVSVDDTSLTGGGPELQQKIWDMAKKVVEEWTGQKLTPSSVYGIRSYKNGAILAPHVDRLPLISSMIINVDQDVDEDWPLEVYGHDGKAYNVTMKPGDMVLYESHSIIHGRPFSLKGRFYANIFVHFEPSKPKTVHQAAQSGDLEALQDASKDDITLLYGKDENLWQAMHEAARSGHETIVKFLVQNGANINALTRGGDTPLDIAISAHGLDHPIVQILIDLGGVQSSNIDEDFEDSEL